MATTYDKASLVMIPSGYKDDKLYSVKPTDGSGDFTFSRDGSGASPATRVNASGYIEKGRTNELLQSNTFDNASWTKTRATLTGGQSGYDGSSDAWAFVDDTNNSTHLLYQPLSSLGAEVATMSVYAAAADVNFIAFRFEGAAVDYAYFDLANGTLGTIDSDYIEARITDVGGGWYRCEATRVLAASGNQAIMLPAQTDNDPTYAGAGTTAIYIQDAQVELGLIATDVIETTTAPVSAGLLGDMPRLDYSGGATCPSLLLEPSRVNIIPDSEYLANWSQTNATTSSNQATSPEGVNNASLSTATGTGAHAPYDTLAGSVTSGANYTMSIFYKKGTTNYLRFEEGYTGIGIDIDIDAESATPRNGATNANIEDYGNGWYRASFGFTGHGSGSSQIVVYIKNSSDQTSYTASGENVYLYGAMIETGSYPTSYIPTYGSASTRGEDDMDTTYSTAITTDGSVTFFLELDDAPRSAANSTGANFAQDFVSTDFITYNHTGAGLHRIRVNANGSAYYIATSIFQDEPVKIAAVATASSVSVYANGELVNTLSIVGDWTTAGAFYTSITDSVGILPVKQYILFPTALTSSEAIALTTL